MPAAFEAKRIEYYTDLNLPLSADEFVAIQKQELKAALPMLDRGMPKNHKVKFTTRKGKPWIKIAKLKKQPESKNLTVLKGK